MNATNWLPALQWHHNECRGFSNQRCLNFILNGLFRCRSKKASKLRVNGLCEGNLPVTGEFLAQRASNVEKVSIWRYHHGTSQYHLYSTYAPDSLCLLYWAITTDLVKPQDTDGNSTFGNVFVVVFSDWIMLYFVSIEPDLVGKFINLNGLEIYRSAI